MLRTFHRCQGVPLTFGTILGYFLRISGWSLVFCEEWSFESYFWNLHNLNRIGNCLSSWVLVYKEEYIGRIRCFLVFSKGPRNWAFCRDISISGSNFQKENSPFSLTHIILFDEIKKQIKWTRKLLSCKREYPENAKSDCPGQGSNLRPWAY